MSRDYKKKPGKQVTFIERFSNVLSFLTGLILGLFVAVIVYFYEHNIPLENHNPLIKPEITIIEKPNQTHPIDTKEAEIDYEFPKILPNREFSISEWESIDNNTDTTESVQKPEEDEQNLMYVLQVASFKDFLAADEVKAKLALIGVSANVQRVVINGQDIRHRVRVGPYKSRDEMQATREKLTENGFNFMELKLKIEDI